MLMFCPFCLEDFGGGLGPLVPPRCLRKSRCRAIYWVPVASIGNGAGEEGAKVVVS